MAYTTANTTWANGQRPTADDLNRIEANAEGGAKPSLAAAYTPSVGVATNSSGVYATDTVSHTSRTGRVKITIMAVFVNSTGASKTMVVSPARNGSFLGGIEPSVHQVRNGEYATIPCVYVDTTPTIGVTYNYGFRHRSTTDPGPVLSRHYIMVEDI